VRLTLRSLNLHSPTAHYMPLLPLQYLPGLYYEDMIEYPEDVVKVALSRLPEDIQMDRRRRRFRANELNLKHETLPTDLQDYDPFVSYGLSREYQRALKEKQEMHRSW